MDFSQQGRRTGSIASLLQVEHLSRDGIGPLALSLPSTFTKDGETTSVNPSSTGESMRTSNLTFGAREKLCRSSSLKRQANRQLIYIDISMQATYTFRQG